MHPIRNFLIFVALFPVGVTNLAAEKLTATPLEGAGEYDFYLFAPDRRVEIEAYLARIRELDAKTVEHNAEIQKIENELKQASSGSGKRKKTLEWSPMEKITGYSVKVYNANKELIATHNPSENSITLELEEGSYFFQVAAVTKFKTGTYSHMSAFRVTKGRHSASELKLEDQIEILQEKSKLSEKLRADYIAAIQKAALSSAAATTPAADVPAPKEASYFLALDKKSVPQKLSQFQVIPGRDAKITEVSQPQAGNTGAFYWGAGLLGGIQDTSTDFFRVNYGVEGFLRYDKTFLYFLRPQLKLQSEYSPSRSSVFDAMMHTSLYLGVYYPFNIGKGFSIVPALGTGVNYFLLFATAGSASVVQWGIMPALEFHYALRPNLSLYIGAAINFTYDTSGSFLKFVPINLGVTGRF